MSSRYHSASRFVPGPQDEPFGVDGLGHRFPGHDLRVEGPVRRGAEDRDPVIVELDRRLAPAGDVRDEPPLRLSRRTSRVPGRTTSDASIERTGTVSPPPTSTDLARRRSMTALGPGRSTISSSWSTLHGERERPHAGDVDDVAVIERPSRSGWRVSSPAARRELEAEDPPAGLDLEQDRVDHSARRDRLPASAGRARPRRPTR